MRCSEIILRPKCKGPVPLWVMVAVLHLAVAKPFLLAFVHARIARGPGDTEESGSRQSDCRSSGRRCRLAAACHHSYLLRATEMAQNPCHTWSRDWQQTPVLLTLPENYRVQCTLPACTWWPTPIGCAAAALRPAAEGMWARVRRSCLEKHGYSVGRRPPAALNRRIAARRARTSTCVPCCLLLIFGIDGLLFFFF